MNTCRVCKKSSYEKHRFPLFKYSVRHYAHADCGLRKWGVKFFRMIPAAYLDSFPVFAAKEAGLLESLYRIHEQQQGGAV